MAPDAQNEVTRGSAKGIVRAGVHNWAARGARGGLARAGLAQNPMAARSSRQKFSRFKRLSAPVVAQRATDESNRPLALKRLV